MVLINIKVGMETDRMIVSIFPAVIIF